MQRRVDIFIHRPAPRVTRDATRDTRYVVKRGDDGNGGSEWFVQSDDEEVVGDKIFKSKSDAESYARQCQSKKSFADTIRDVLIGGNETPEDKGAKRTPLVADDINSDNPAELRAVGRKVQQYCDTSREVRQWAQSEGYSRVQEAFIVEGFKQARIAAGLSETV